MKRSRFIFFCVGTLILLFLCACNDVVELENVDSSGADKEVIENVNREDSNANIVWENSELDMDGNAWDKLSINNTQVSQHVSNDLYNEVAEQIGEEKATQIRVMAENSDQWKLQDYAPTKGLYMVYDLDGDGRLELIANAVQGTGAYSHNYFYQINPENTAVVELEQVLEDEKPLCFDIGLDWEQKVYVDENGTHYYYAIDYEGSGTWQTICKEGYFYLSDGKVGRIMLRESVNQLQENGTYEKTYYTADGIYEKTYDTPDSSESISEEEWNHLLQTFAEGKEETSVNIAWVSLYEEEGEAMSADEWFVLLADSYLKSSSL